MRLMRKRLHHVVVYGLISGLFLAALLKVIEQITHLKVYTLLLNIDYFPYINQFTFPEIIEVSFHLIVSIALSGCLYALIVQMKIFTRKKILILCISIYFLIGLALFPTTMLSDRTPAFLSIPSLSFWLIGHIGYGYVLGELIARNVPKAEADQA